jgi:hypothetical protein
MKCVWDGEKVCWFILFATILLVVLLALSVFPR